MIFSENGLLLFLISDEYHYDVFIKKNAKKEAYKGFF